MESPTPVAVAFPAAKNLQVPQITMAAFGIFCPKSMWEKSQFYVEWSKKSEKNEAIFVMSILKLDKFRVYILVFLIFLLVGT